MHLISPVWHNNLHHSASCCATQQVGASGNNLMISLLFTAFYLDMDQPGGGCYSLCNLLLKPSSTVVNDLKPLMFVSCPTQYIKLMAHWNKLKFGLIVGESLLHNT